MMRVVTNPKRRTHPNTILLIAFVWTMMLSGCASYKSEVSWPDANDEIHVHTIPVYKLNKTILVKGEVDGKSGYFIFDTGAPGLVLNQAHFSDYEIYPTRKATGVNGSAREVKIKYVFNLKLSQINFRQQRADVIDLSHLEKNRDVKILGLLGVKLFTGVELEIDLRKHLLSIYKLDENGYRLSVQNQLKRKEYVMMPFKYSGALIELQAEINNHIYRVAFDTGAETLLLDKKLVARDSIQTSFLSQRKLLSTDGSRSSIEIGEIEHIKIGLNLERVPMVMTNLRRLRSYGLNVDGLIGYDLMASGIVTINFKTRILHIQPYAKA